MEKKIELTPYSTPTLSTQQLHQRGESLSDMSTYNRLVSPVLVDGATRVDGGRISFVTETDSVIVTIENPE